MSARATAELLAFPHDGTHVQNPFLSECSRFAVDPRQYGFKEWETGGGCVALVKEIEGGHTLWLTDESGDGFPDLQDTDSAMYGRYDEEREEVCLLSIAELIAAIAE